MNVYSRRPARAEKSRNMRRKEYVLNTLKIKNGKYKEANHQKQEFAKAMKFTQNRRSTHEKKGERYGKRHGMRMLNGVKRE